MLEQEVVVQVGVADVSLHGVQEEYIGEVRLNQGKLEKDLAAQINELQVAVWWLPTRSALQFVKQKMCMPIYILVLHNAGRVPWNG